MKKIQIFLGGGVRLLHGDNADLRGYRQEVIDPVISILNSQENAKQLFIAKDYTDLTRHVVNDRHQEVYNRYIRKARIALFVIDGSIGNITKEEIDTAVASAKKTRHPIVYIYGKDIEDNRNLLDYLNQEGIYYQHFYDKRDLADKIKTDLTSSLHVIHKRTLAKTITLLSLFVFFLCLGYLFLKQNNIPENTMSQCTSQLYLMRYKDVNVLTNTSYFTEPVLDNFKYEDSVGNGNDRFVFPIFDTCNQTIVVTNPFFRLKLHNKQRNTLVFVEAMLEIDQYEKNNVTNPKKLEKSDVDLSIVDHICVDGISKEYHLKSFRQSLAYGEIDDRYFFTISAPENCSFRMRVKAKSQNGDFLYSNYVYVRYIQ